MLTGTITGTFLDADGAPIFGRVAFAPNTTGNVLDANGNVAVSKMPREVKLDVDGSFTITLAATDDPSLNPTGWTYTFAYDLNGDRGSYPITVLAGQTLDIADISPVAESNGVYSYVGPQGPAGATGAKGDPGTTPLAQYKYQQPSSVITTFQTGHGWAASGSLTSSDMNATDNFIKGTQSAKVVTNGSAFLKKTGMPAFDLTGKALRFVMHMTNRAGLSNIVVRIGTSNLANAFRFRANARNTPTQSIGVENEWFTFTLGWADVLDAQGGTWALTNGVPSVTSGFTDIEINLSNGAGGPVTFHVQSVEVVDAPKAKYPNGVVTLGFDDGWDTQSLLFPAMDKYGYRGTIYTIADNVGTTGRHPLSVYKNLQTNGWEIAGHAYTQQAHDDRYITKTAAQVETECASLRSWLYTNGFDGTTFAYPGGEFDVTTDGVLVGDIVRQHFAAARSILFSTGVNAHFRSDAVLPPSMPWRIHAISGIAENKPATSADSPTYITAAGGVLDKVKNAGAWLNLTFHEGTTGVSDNGMLVGQAAFASIVDGIASRGMACLPASEVLADYRR